MQKSLLCAPTKSMFLTDFLLRPKSSHKIDCCETTN
jgi:hypothetical protein